VPALIGAVLAAVLLVGVAAPVTTASTRSWRGPWTVGAAGVSPHSLASAAGVLHAVSRQVDDAGRGNLVYRRSVDGGRSWSAGRVLWHSPVAPILYPATIEARGSMVVVAFRVHGSTGGEGLIRVSRDRGRTWEPARVFARSTGTRDVGLAALAIAPSGIDVAWTDTRTGAVDLRRSADGRVFGPVERVGTTHWDQMCAGGVDLDGLVALAADGPRLFVVWGEGDGSSCVGLSLVIRRSADGGRSFGPVVTAVDDANWSEASVIARGDLLLIAVESSWGDAWLARSITGGRTFDLEDLDARYDWELPTIPDLALGPDGRVVATWTEFDTADLSPDQDGTQIVVTGSSVVAQLSADVGRTWSPREVILHSKTDQFLASAAGWARTHPVVVATRWNKSRSDAVALARVSGIP
jgi:hypothetical protein